MCAHTHAHRSPANCTGRARNKDPFCSGHIPVLFYIASSGFLHSRHGFTTHHVYICLGLSLHGQGDPRLHGILDSSLPTHIIYQTTIEKSTRELCSIDLFETISSLSTGCRARCSIKPGRPQPPGALSNKEGR